MKYTWSQIINGECDRIEDVPVGVTIDSVDEKECFGRCEGCGSPILEVENYASDKEGYLLCATCIEQEDTEINVKE